MKLSLGINVINKLSLSKFKHTSDISSDDDSIKQNKPSFWKNEGGDKAELYSYTHT